ncbi:LAME_0E09208g1_1 [Lachancea meyersii CBS 8951]|uniref:LAME_0E09208g1_1 n=1 Tax=Lachancea meyersii CBS 8951 TaxID=1266667 RepID=A0A1G4JJC3_9SACH|nr:LAME_0E09208g1_1 [Lachancea meyersii CBS 8951]
MAKNVSTLPVDSNVESKEAKAGGNLAHKAYSEMAGTKAEKRHSNVSNSGSNKEILVASNAQGVMKLPVPNDFGTVGPAPLEITDPKQFRTAPSRDINLHDTSIDRAAYEERERSIKKIEEALKTGKSDSAYPWKSIGAFFGSGRGPSNADSGAVKAYITEKFYNDLYYNMAGIVGTCYFSWLLAYWRFSWLALFVVFFCAASVYRTEFRRFNRNIRDDLTRIVVEETLSDRKESTLWLNSFLSKFWVIYMPVLSQQVKDIANPQLAGVAPGYGIDALSLDEFTLGTKAPTIDGITSYTKKGKDTVEMDWEFSFTPNDVSSMTPKEAKEKINPKIALGVTVGKGFVSKSLPVLVEDINCKGRMRFTIKLGPAFPNIKIVSLSLLEPPFIDFALKPVGGDTLGLDIMSFLPGLKTFVKTMINSNVGPMLYNPHKLDIDVEEIVAAQSKDAIGVVAVTIHSADDLKGSDFLGNTIDPYVALTAEKGNIGETTIRTSVKSDTKSPRWNETKYVLVNSLDQKLFFSCYDFNSTRKDSLIGKAEYKLSQLFQTAAVTGQSAKLVSGGGSRGILNYDLHWLPVVNEEVSSGPRKEDKKEEEGLENEEQEEDDGEAFQSESDVGILKATFHKAKFLKASKTLQGALSPSAELSIDGKVVKKYRTLRRINEPSWEECVEVLVPSKKNSTLLVKVFDDGMAGKELLCEYSSSMADILAVAEAGQRMLKASPQGELYFSAVWKPIAMSGAFAPANAVRDPLGVVRLHIKDAMIDENLSGVGDIDPYVTVSLNKQVTYKTNYFSDNREPHFNNVVYVPITSESQSVLLNVMDYQKVGKDRNIGSYTIPVDKVMQKDPKTNKYVPIKKPETSQCRLLGKKMNLTKSFINVEMSFLPVTQVYSPDELVKVEQLEAKIKEREDKFAKEQEKLRQEMEAHPDQYEVVEMEVEDESSKSIKKKEKWPVEKILSVNSGVLDYQVLRGKLSRQSAHLQVLFDDIATPASTSMKSKAGEVVPDSGSCFIRDLNHSRITFRLTKNHEPKNLDDVLGEQSFSVKELLKKGIKEPIAIKAHGSEIEVRFLYTPAETDLPLNESIEDTGSLKLKVISADDLPSHDRNNKSDPFVVVKVDGKKVEKTEVIKKTLSPVWNEILEIPVPSRSRCDVQLEVYDWDRTGSNDLLCSTAIDAKMLAPGKTHDLNFNLDPQGTIKVEATFTPEYLFPALDPAKGGLAVKPFKALGGVATMGVGVAGAGLGTAQNVASAGFGTVQKGGKFLKGFGSKKSKKDTQAHRISQDTEERDGIDAQKAPKLSMDYDVTKPNTSYAEVRSGNGPGQETAATSPKNGEGSSVVGAPGPIHKRSSSTASSFARTLAPNGTYKGKVTVIGAQEMGKASLQLRVSLAQGGRMKHMYRTESRKTNSEGRVEFNESCEFKASPDANLVFGGVATHRFGKDIELGVAQVHLGDAQIQQDGILALKLGKGNLLLRIEYGDSDVPPVPAIPSEYNN